MGNTSARNRRTISSSSAIRHEIRIQSANEHFLVFVGDRFYCSCDSYREAEEEADNVRLTGFPRRAAC